MSTFIFGSDETQGVVSVEDADGTVELFYEGGRRESRLLSYWALSPTKHSSQWEELQGDGYYKFRRRYQSWQELLNDRGRFADLYVVYDPKEAALIETGITYYKGMKVSDVSVLAFDIETTGLKLDSSARVLIISNTYRRGDHVSRKLFCYDDYPTAAAMFEDWCSWVRACNPSIIVGHNIFGYDLPYLEHCAKQVDVALTLGRDGSPLWFNNFESKYRRDGSQFYMYRGANVYGREIVDTFFLSMKYDVGRKYESYGLKSIIKAEGLEVEGRQHYDAGKISTNYQVAEEWRKIKAYAEHDADDALALYDLMIPAYFYLAQSVPRSLQHIINSASGAWLNSFLVRSYLQKNHSIPKASEAVDFEGAISIGNPGIYSKVFKVDCASLYPSVILSYKIHNPIKDPSAHYLRMVEHFTTERLQNKKRAKETGDQYWADLEQAQKIFINSAYGLLGTPGLPFNSPEHGAQVTKHGREILTKAIEWASLNGLQLVNADTDSISISVSNSGRSLDRQAILASLNELSPKGIRWEDDGLYDAVLVLKAKNYVMRTPEGKIKIKGSALKASPKEKGLKEFIDRTVVALLDGKQADLPALYWQYADEILNLKDISRWTLKRTVTETIYTSQRENEAKVVRALVGTGYRVGDKCYLYYTADDELKLQEQWTGDHSTTRLLKKLWDTAQIFSTVIDTKQFPNLTLKRNRNLLARDLTLS